MNMMNKLMLALVFTVACSVTAEAQQRRYQRSNRGYSYSYSNNTVQTAPQPQTVYKPVVTNSTPVTTSKIVPVSHTVSSTPVVAEANGLGGIEAEVVAQTNSQRARYGLRPLSICPNLMGSARQHCQWMASANSMTHTRAAVAENIAMGQSGPSDAMNSWMNSSGHRANILGGGYSTIGVAAFTGSNGQLFWCQQFR